MNYFDHVSQLNFEDTKWLVEGILPCQAFGAIVGASYSCKTFFALDIALCVSSGVPFHGFETRRGSVAYIAGEGARGLVGRIEAWGLSHGLNASDSDLFVSKQPFNFRDPKAVCEIKSDLNEIDHLSLIIVDTLNRNFGAGNENGPEHMGEFIDACTTLMADFGCGLIVVHHMGKDMNGSRGHSSLYGALDTEISIRRKGKHDLLVSNTKQKDDAEFHDMQFVQTVTGNSITLEAVAVSKDKVHLSASQRLAFDILCELYKASKASPIHLDNWRDEFKRRHTGDNPKSKDKAHQRARSELRNKGLIDVDRDLYSPCLSETFDDT